MTELNRWADPVALRIKKHNFSTSDDPKLHPLWICIQDAISHGGGGRAPVKFFSETELVDMFIRKCKQAYVTYITPDPPLNRDRDRKEEIRIVKVYAGLLDKEKNFFNREDLESVFITRGEEISRIPRPEVLELVKHSGPVDFLDKIRKKPVPDIQLGQISLPVPNFSTEKLIALSGNITLHLDNANRLYPTDERGAMCEYMKFVGLSTRMVNLMKRPDMFEVFDKEREDEPTCNFLDEMEWMAGKLKPLIIK